MRWKKGRHFQIVLLRCLESLQGRGFAPLPDLSVVTVNQGPYFLAKHLFQYQNSA